MCNSIAYNNEDWKRRNVKEVHRLPHIFFQISIV